MAQQLPTPHRKSAPGAKKSKPQVYVLRDIREYLGESVLIIFSVLLALILTEYFNNLHEKNQTKDVLNNIKNELIKNKKSEQEQYVYQQGILRRIDSALNNVALQQKMVSNGSFNFKYIAPEGVMLHDLSRVAWQVAQTHNITIKINFVLVEKLTDIYDNQARIDKLEDKVANVLLSYESRRPENVRQTLILIRDNYRGWAFDRAPSLIKKYDEGIAMIDSKKL
ncbi:MAG: hypothetical protein M3N14_00425 [Bacteroidota bacterium]|nr:hypothetical protein [Bacteroidota bacterium]